MSAAIAEVHAFLAALAGTGAAPRQVPQILRALVQRVGRGRHEADDLLQELLADLLVRTRKGQAGGIAQLLRLDDGQLLGAIRRRAVQVRAIQQGSRSRLVKTLRAHVTAALDGELPDADGLPLTLMVGDRICGRLVRQAVAYLLAQDAAPPREPSVLAAQLLDLFFALRPEDVRAEVHGGAETNDADATLARADAAHHVQALRARLGPELARIVGLRAQGRSLAEIAAGRVGISTVHEKLGRATTSTREYVAHEGLAREDLEPALPAVAAWATKVLHDPALAAWGAERIPRRPSGDLWAGSECLGLSSDVNHSVPMAFL